MILNFASVALLPLAESTTMGFTAPIFATILSALALREATGMHRWGAVLAGFVGVIVMARPDVELIPLTGLLVGLGAGIGTATVSILIRDLSRTETAPVIVFWFTLLSLPPALVGLLIYGQAHDGETIALILAMGTAGGIAQLFLTTALKFAPVSLVMPMDYSSILWAMLIGWIIWGALPFPSTWIGAAIIVASGLYIVWREHVRGLKARLAAEAAADMRG